MKSMDYKIVTIDLPRKYAVLHAVSQYLALDAAPTLSHQSSARWDEGNLEQY